MKMGNPVPVIVIIVLVSSANCATTSTSTETPTATVTTPTTGAPPSDCAGGVGQLGKQYAIVSTRLYKGLVWTRPSDGRYVVTCNPGCSPIAGYSATINATHTTLTIASLTQVDVGGWGLLDAKQSGAVPVTVCRLGAAGLPQCSISSDEDTDSLEPGTQLTLTVEITDYNCSVETGFDLTTGAVTDDLVKTHNGVNLTMNDTFNVTLTRLGDVTLTFVCGTRWNLICGGVQKLIKSPPQCNIHGDTDTNALVPGTNLTLTVNISNYYCPRETGFNLTTGHVTEELMATHKVSDVSDVSVNTTFSVDVRTLGDVTLTFVCDGTWNLTCNGVHELFKTPPQCNINGDTDTNALVPGTNLTLTVDIKNFYCWHNAGFVLTTGGVNNVLLQNQTTSNITDTAVTTSFVVGADHLGDVSVTYKCDNTSTLLTCGGVEKLTAVSSTRESISSTADFPSKEPITSTAGPSTRAGLPTATAGSSTRAGSPAATADFPSKEPITSTAGPSTRAGLPTATAGSSTRAGSPAATALTQPMGGSPPTVTQETSASPTTISGTSGSLDIAIIVIIVLFAIVFLIVIIAVIVCCRRR